MPYPEGGLPFHSYHANLGPSNITVPEKGNVEGILDWESVGFYPRHWIVSKSIRSVGFYLKSTEGMKRVARRDLLITMLVKEGFELA